MVKPKLTDSKGSRAGLRLAKKRTRNSSEEEEKGAVQQNIKSFFGTNTGQSQLWTTIDSEKNGKKKNLKLTTRKDPQVKNSSPYFVQRKGIEDKTTSSSNHRTDGLFCENQRKEKEFTRIVESNTTSHLSKPVPPSLSDKKKNEVDVVISPGTLKSNGFTSFPRPVNGQDMESPSSASRVNKKAHLSTKRNKKASLMQKERHVKSSGGTSHEPDLLVNGYHNDVVVSEDDDLIPPTPSPVSRHSFINGHVKQSGLQGRTSISHSSSSWKDNCKGSSRNSTISYRTVKTESQESHSKNLALQKSGLSMEVLVEKQSLFVADNMKTEQNKMFGENGKHAVNCKDAALKSFPTSEDGKESSLSHSNAASLCSPDSQSTLKTSRKKYKLTRKGKPLRVVSSPLKSQHSHGQVQKSPHHHKECNGKMEVPGELDSPIVIAPSKCVVLRSRMKRSATKGSSPSQKRQQTVLPLAAKNEAKCNLWNKLDGKQSEESEASFGHQLLNSSEHCSLGDNLLVDSHVVEGYIELDASGGFNKVFLRNDVTSVKKLQNVGMENSYCPSEEQNNFKEKVIHKGGSHLLENVKQVGESFQSHQSQAHEGFRSPKSKNVKSQVKQVKESFQSPPKLNSLQAQLDLNTSKDSLADAADFDSLLEGVEWSPMVSPPNKLETSSRNSTACKALFSSIPDVQTEAPNIHLKSTCTSTVASLSSSTSGVNYSRFLVLEVSRRELDHQVVAQYGRQLSEKVLRLFDEMQSQEWFCCLREDWEMTEVEPGDIVHITGTFDKETEMCILDNATDRYIVVHPDTLISGTSVSMATKCLRQSILNERFKTEGQNEAMMIGTLLHDLFDEAMEFSEFSAEAILSRASGLLQKFSYLNDLYSLGQTENWALEKIKENIPQFSEWARKFVVPSPHPDLGAMDFKTPENPQDTEQPSVCVSALKDIEENIWSPRFGLKGKVDATVEVKVDRRPKMRRHRPDKGHQVQTKVIPLELKTGKMFSKLGSIEHRAQVILYTLLMSDRYQAVDSGLLFYMKSGHMLGVPAFLHEKRALVMKRNEVARYMTLNRATRAMPAMLRDLNTCRRCSQASNCTVFHKAVEVGDHESSGLGTFFDDMTGHMTNTYTKYFTDWFKLVCLEGKEMEEKRNQMEIWCLGSFEREKLGRCFSGMILVPCGHDRGVVNGRFYKHVFVRVGDHPSVTPLQDVPITCGDRVVVSEEHGGAVALAAGFIHEVTQKNVAVLLDRDLTKRYDTQTEETSSKMYRLDKDNEYSTLTTLWSNMAQLFKGDSDRDGQLRRQIVDLQPPVFSRKKKKDTVNMSSQTSDISEFFSQQTASQSSCSQSMTDPAVESILQELNSGQRKAVSKALCAHHYALILGMPGTGKTTTISCLVRVLVASGKTVLLTSYTHTAVDNILLKLKEAKLDFLRLGQVHKILPELQSYSAQTAAADIKTVNELKNFYESKSVVATTCLGVKHALFSQRSFDYCIVDEASQITQPVCIGPLRHARVFILVGDHYQLPPLVQSVEAREGGMDVSLFKRLSERHPQAVINLEHQYRMNQDIMELSNTLIYEHRLQCGTEGVARAVLELPNWDELVTHVKRKTAGMTDNWLLDALAPSRAVVFLDTDSVPAPETRSEHLVSNETEALLVQQLACALLKGGVEPCSLGIISPYRHQLKLISKILFRDPNSRQNQIEINTVDKYQGRDKSCIIVSLVRSNEHSNVGDLLRDWRRVNVAVTRAKRKLILIGSLTTLKGSLLLQELFDLLQSRDWVQGLPFGAHELNLFAADTPQASPVSSLTTQARFKK